MFEISGFMLLLIAHLVVAVPVCIHILLTKHETAAPAWIALVLISPFVGSGLYWILGINRVERRARRLRGRRPRFVPHTTPPVPPFPGLTTLQHRQLFQYQSAVNDTPYVGGNRVTPLIGGAAAYADMLGAIAEAQACIALSVYIFDLDDIGRKFISALTAAHDRGVKIYVLVDEIGSGLKSRAADIELAKAGIATARFIPQKLKLLPIVNLRNHRKILILDGQVGYIGGMNICRNYSDDAAETIRDLHFRVTGPALEQMSAIFEEDWTFATDATIDLPATDPAPSDEDQPLYARVIADGPDNAFQRTLWVMLGALASSQKSVHVLTPYFLPNDALYYALSICALRGVDVRVVVPAKTDIRLVDWAMAAKFQDLIEHGVKIYAGGPIFDHSKLMIVDDTWVLVGSSNWDQRSLRLNFEANLECYDSALAGELERHFQTMLRTARPIALATLRALPVMIKLRNNIARLFTPYL